MKSIPFSGESGDHTGVILQSRFTVTADEFGQYRIAADMSQRVIRFFRSDFWFSDPWPFAEENEAVFDGHADRIQDRNSKFQ